MVPRRQCSQLARLRRHWQTGAQKAHAVAQHHEVKDRAFLQTRYYAICRRQFSADTRIRGRDIWECVAAIYYIRRIDATALRHCSVDISPAPAARLFLLAAPRASSFTIIRDASTTAVLRIQDDDRRLLRGRHRRYRMLPLPCQKGDSHQRISLIKRRRNTAAV